MVNFLQRNWKKCRLLRLLWNIIQEMTCIYLVSFSLLWTRVSSGGKTWNSHFTYFSSDEFQTSRVPNSRRPKIGMLRNLFQHYFFTNFLIWTVVSGEGIFLAQVLQNNQCLKFLSGLIINHVFNIEYYFCC